MSMYQFTPRQWTQVRAALTFWKAAVESSSIHPSQHPLVAALYGPVPHGPLSLPEIEELMREMPPKVFVTIEDIADMIGVPKHRIQYALEHVDPAVGPQRKNLYWWRDVKPIVEKLHAKFAARGA